MAEVPGSALIARQHSITRWCDFHLMAVYQLAPLMTDRPAVVASALAEVLADPRNSTGRRTRRPRNTRAFPFSSDRCPEEASSLDRVELALGLLGERTSAGVSVMLGVPEHEVVARLHSGLIALFAPCDRRDPRSRRR
ncbi:hypothetical protein [Streptacidiphilus sp. PAMC 29251]